MANPPRSTASALAWPSATRFSACASPDVSSRSMRPRKDASVFVRALNMRRFPLEGWPFGLRREPEAGSFVHDMFLYKANGGRGVNRIGEAGDFAMESKGFWHGRATQAGNPGGCRE